LKNVTYNSKNELQKAKQMQKKVSIAAAGLVVDDRIARVKAGVEYEQLRGVLPLLPELEGDLITVNKPGLTEILHQIEISDLFEQTAGGSKVERELGGGLNALEFITQYVTQTGLGVPAGAFALGSYDGEFDEPARHILENSKKIGIDMSACIKLQGDTPQTVAIVRKINEARLERTFFHSPGVSDTATAENYIQALESICPGAVGFYYLNNGERMGANGGKGIQRLFQYLQTRNIITFLDSAGDRDMLKKSGVAGLLGSGVLQYTSIFAPSALEASSITGCFSPTDIAHAFGLYQNNGPEIVILKNGIGGNFIFTGNRGRLTKRLHDRIDEKSWESQIIISPAIHSDRMHSSVGAGDKALATGIAYLMANAISPYQFGKAISAGGAIAIAGERLTVDGLNRLMFFGKPIYL
jgi:sugar/nucleoside kinase (ribokinase family)